jgi:hypothetical protein
MSEIDVGQIHNSQETALICGSKGDQHGAAKGEEDLELS